MTTLTRWEPFREMANLSRMMDRFFDEPFTEMPTLWRRGDGYSLALDVAEQDDQYVVKASVPGIKPEDIEITLTDNVLTIKGETKDEKEIEEEKYHMRERHYGSFTRTIALPVTVNADKIEAVNENGVLTLTLPKAEAVKPKRIEVKKMIESK
ncbi:MAG: Hsp20/alpha crystallin family protein [Caldilineaceae bacterium]